MPEENAPSIAELERKSNDAKRKSIQTRTKLDAAIETVDKLVRETQLADIAFGEAQAALDKAHREDALKGE